MAKAGVALLWLVLAMLRFGARFGASPARWTGPPGSISTAVVVEAWWAGDESDLRCCAVRARGSKLRTARPDNGAKEEKCPNAAATQQVTKPAVDGDGSRLRLQVGKV